MASLTDLRVKNKKFKLEYLISRAEVSIYLCLGLF